MTPLHVIIKSAFRLQLILYFLFFCIQSYFFLHRTSISSVSHSALFFFSFQFSYLPQPAVKANKTYFVLQMNAAFGHNVCMFKYSSISDIKVLDFCVVLCAN